MITINGKEFRNLVEQVKKNQEDIAKHYDIEQTLADWGIKVVGRQDTWEPPAGSFAFGDAIAVGPEGGPFDFYIWTRKSDLGDEGYWLNYGPISIVGPQGPEGKQGPQGEPGKAGRWFVGPSEPTGNVGEGDLWLRVNSDGSTNGFVYQYNLGGWALQTTILGPQGIQGRDGKEGKQGPPGPQGPQGKDGNPSPVINIIAELPEGTVISDIYNPTTVASNSGILMPVGGVNHLWIIINGLWTDSGSWGQGGTRVYENGEEVVEFDADTKVDTVGALSNGRVLVYTNDYDGTTPSTSATKVHYLGNNENNMRPYAVAMVFGATAGKVVPMGNLITATPVNTYHCANKKYVDDTISHEIIAHINDQKRAVNLRWDYLGQELSVIVDIGVFASTVLQNYDGDFTAWGGNLALYGFGGLVNTGNGYMDNEEIMHRLWIRCDTGEVKLQCIYSSGQSWTSATDLTTFELGGITHQGGTQVQLDMIPASGLPGGIFQLNPIP